MSRHLDILYLITNDDWPTGAATGEQRAGELQRFQEIAGLYAADLVAPRRYCCGAWQLHPSRCPPLKGMAVVVCRAQAQHPDILARFARHVFNVFELCGRYLIALAIPKRNRTNSC